MALVLEPSEFNIDDLTFSIQNKSFEVNKVKMTYQSIILKYQGTQEYYIRTPKMFSFGIKSSTFGGSKPKYSTSFVMKDKEGATPEQIEFYTLCQKIVQKTKAWMIEHKMDLKTPGLAENMLENLSPIYEKKDEHGNVVADAIPTLNCNLKQGKDRITTDFYEDVSDLGSDVEGKLIDPMTLLSTEDSKKYYTMSEGAITFPDVYYAKGKPSKLHCVLEEATVMLKRERTTRLTGKGGKRAMLYNPLGGEGGGSNSGSVSDKMEQARLHDELQKELDGMKTEKVEKVETVEKKAEKKVEKKVEKLETDEGSESESESEPEELPKQQVVKSSARGVPRRQK